MNEPHDIGNLSAWADTVQAAVTAIRMAGATRQTITLPGTEFTHASAFVENGSAGNLSRVHNPDGTNTGLVFEVHQYLDSDGSGTALDCVTDHVQDAFMPLAQFLVSNGRKALLGEIGGGNTSSVSSVSDTAQQLSGQVRKLGISRLIHEKTVLDQPMQFPNIHQCQHRCIHGLYRLGSRRILFRWLQLDHDS
jgi:hypothetical protein